MSVRSFSVVSVPKLRESQVTQTDVCLSLKMRFVQKLNEPSSGSGFFSPPICGSGCVATPAVRGSTAASGSLGKINVPRFKRLYLSSCRLSVTKPLPCPVHPSPPPPSAPVIFPPCRPRTSRALTGTLNPRH